jgi:hypothetical protein
LTDDAEGFENRLTEPISAIYRHRWFRWFCWFCL